jgi:CBS domain-containing protein
MTPDPIVIDGLATVREAIDVMHAKRVSSLVIDRRHPGDEYGIVVVHDVAEHVIGNNLSPERTNVYEIMSKPVLCLDAAMGIKYAVRMLTRFRLSRALVMEGGALVGIVTQRDLVFRYLLADEGRG